MQYRIMDQTRLTSTEFQWSWSRALELVELADVTLSCEGHCLLAHKLVLSACSPYFRGVFKENPCQHPIIILKNVLAKDITRLLAFMYQGEVQIQEADLSSFLQTAELLQVKGLTQHHAQEKKTSSKAPNLSTFTSKMNIMGSPKKLNNNNLQQVIGKASSKKRRMSGSEKTSDCQNSETTTKRIKQTKDKSPVGKKTPITEKKTESLEKQITDKDKDNADNSSTNLPLSLTKQSPQDDAQQPSVSQVQIKSEAVDPEPEDTNQEPPENATEDRSESPESPKPLYEYSMLARSLMSGVQAIKGDTSLASTSGKSKPQLSLSTHTPDEVTVKQEIDSPESDIPELEPEILISEQSESVVSVQSPIAGGSKASGSSQRSANAGDAGSGQSNHAAICGDCPHCGTKYSNQSALKYHVRLMHSDLTNRLCCYLCPQTFTMRDIFKEHMWTSHGLRN